LNRFAEQLAVASVCGSEVSYPQICTDLRRLSARTREINLRKSGKMKRCQKDEKVSGTFNGQDQKGHPLYKPAKAPPNRVIHDV
jgi:hypothetical protein